MAGLGAGEGIGVFEAGLLAVAGGLEGDDAAPDDPTCKETPRGGVDGLGGGAVDWGIQCRCRAGFFAAGSLWRR